MSCAALKKLSRNSWEDWFVVVNRSKGSAKRAPNRRPIRRLRRGRQFQLPRIPFELFDLPHGLCAMRLLIFPNGRRGSRRPGLQLMEL